MKTAREALANHLGMDFADLPDYNYCYGHFTKTVYALPDGYYCATKDVKKLPTPTRKSREPLNWHEVSDSYVNKYGWHIFKADLITQ